MPRPGREEHHRFWRLRAEELRATASQFKDQIARKGLLDAAEFYDKLADQIEKAPETAGAPAETTLQQKRRKAASRPRRP